MGEIMKNVKKAFEMINYNIWTLVGFESLFKVLSLAIFTPLFFNLFNLIMKFRGFKYLSFENIGAFLLNPKTFLWLLLLIILLTIYTMFDITTIIIILDESYNKRKIKVIDAVRISLRKCRQVFFPTNILLSFMVLFLIPFLNIGLASSFVSTIRIPEFIMEFIMQNNLFLGILIGVVLILSIILFRWIYAIHYFVLEDINFFKAKKKSILLSKKNHLQDLLIIIVVQLISVIVYFVFVLLGIVAISFINQVCDVLWLKSFTMSIIWVFIVISFWLFAMLATPIAYATISSLFYYNKEKKKEEIKVIERVKYDCDVKINKKIKVISFFAVLLAIMGSSIFIYGVDKGKFNLNIEHVRKIEVTAHRGSSVKYPENTMLAFRKAKEEGADFIELDVQETKDGQLIVMHDSNFKRTTGLNKNTWELDLEEVKKLDAGSYFSREFAGEKIPTLEEVVIFAKENNVKLNIELKPSGHEHNLEQKVVDLINYYDFKDDCVVTSGVYEVLQNVKKCDSLITTVYVMCLAYGDITALKDADHFSVEESSVRKSMVKKIHQEGKKIMVWTVNSEDKVLRMIDLDVDNIITDNIKQTKDVIYANKTSNIIQEFVKSLAKVF